MTKKELFNAINNMDEKYIRNTQDVYKQQQANEVIRISEEKRQPYWRIIFATALCTAAAMFAVFVPIARSGAIGFLAPASGTESDSGGVVLSNSGDFENSNAMSSEIKIDLDKETNYDVVLDAIFVFDKQSNTFKRYEFGDIFATDKLLMGGRSYFRNDNGDLQLYRQELTLSLFKSLELECAHIISNERGTEILLCDSLSEKLGLPNFFETSSNEGDFLLHTDKLIGDTESKKITIHSVTITVNYDANNIAISSDEVIAL